MSVITVLELTALNITIGKYVVLDYLHTVQALFFLFAVLLSGNYWRCRQYIAVLSIGLLEMAQRNARLQLHSFIKIMFIICLCHSC